MTYLERLWREQAACRGSGPGLFSAGPNHPGAAEFDLAAKASCAECPVRTACSVAGTGEPYGIWGGLSTRERRQLGKQARGAAA
jgi:WhiB family redox-sensing transcriptional regulator